MTTTARAENFLLSTLPGRYYSDPEIYELEQERIFSQMWVCVGRADTLADPGAYQLATIGQESIIVVRDRDGALQAFLNVCRHRGARLCTQASGQLKGSIQCRYHAWTYALDGRLLGAPNDFMECYHCGLMHPELCQLLPGFRSGKTYEDGDAATLAESAEAFTITGKASRPPLPGLLAEDLRRYYGIVLLPNMLLNLLDDHVVVHTLYPAEPKRTHVICQWLFDAQAMTRPDFDPMDAVEIFDLVNRQDWEVCELTQLSMTSKAFRSGGVYVPAERHIREFADFVLEHIAIDSDKLPGHHLAIG